MMVEDLSRLVRKAIRASKLWVRIEGYLDLVGRYGCGSSYRSINGDGKGQEDETFGYGDGLGDGYGDGDHQYHYGNGKGDGGPWS